MKLMLAAPRRPVYKIRNRTPQHRSGGTIYFSILIHDEPGTAALRDKYRKAHLDYLKEFDDQTLFAGPFVTDDESADLGSLRLIDFPDLATAEKHVADEPYVTGGVQKRWQIHRWKPALPHTWRDCPRTEGNIQAMFYGLDAPSSKAKREQHRQAHRDYLSRHTGSIMILGPMLDATGTEQVGSLLLLDVPDMAAARTLMAGDPFNKAGLYGETVFHRWRFGRVFDRFKV
jgi:uncharacterized protein YciI